MINHYGLTLEEQTKIVFQILGEDPGTIWIDPRSDKWQNALDDYHNKLAWPKEIHP